MFYTFLRVLTFWAPKYCMNNNLHSDWKPSTYISYWYRKWIFFYASLKVKITKFQNYKMYKSNRLSERRSWTLFIQFKILLVNDFISYFCLPWVNCIKTYLINETLLINLPAVVKVVSISRWLRPMDFQCK